MLKIIARSILVAGTLAASGFGVSLAPASAGEVRSETAAPNLVVAQRADRRYDRDVCSARQAIRKAQRLGLRRPQIVRDNRRAVVVDGYRRGRLATVRFAQVRGCPVLSVR